MTPAAEIPGICDGCRDAPDCLLSYTPAALERCDRAARAAEAEAAARIDMGMINRVIEVVVLETGHTPAEVSAKLQAWARAEA